MSDLDSDAVLTVSGTSKSQSLFQYIQLKIKQFQFSSTLVAGKQYKVFMMFNCPIYRLDECLLIGYSKYIHTMLSDNCPLSLLELV